MQEIGRDVADYCRARFAAATGSFDAYVVFIERGLQLLRPGGRLGFIVPNKLFKLDYGRRLRERFAREGLVEEILDFGSSQLFAGVTNYTCILILDRTGGSELAYRRLSGTGAEVLEELATGGAVGAQHFAARSLGEAPWALVPPEEAAVLQAAAETATRLEEVTEQIFQGLITSADDVYLVEDRGARGGLRVVWSRASRRELELEPTFLHPMASGVDVERYAFRPLNTLLLFPYVSDGATMRLANSAELGAAPRTRAYLEQHEALLRAREGGRMDDGDWYRLSRPQNLTAHARPKLGVAATVRRLEIAADLEGAIHFHNVRVNGILGRDGGPSLETLLLLLNSRLLDWVFRRGAADHANGYFAANKQFISGLPIRLPDGATGTRELTELGRRLHDNAAAISRERGSFLDWLAATVGVRRAALPGVGALERYDALTANELVDRLARSRPKLPVDPRERARRGS